MFSKSSNGSLLFQAPATYSYFFCIDETRPSIYNILIMKLERMNEQQIRCTLTKEDLNARSIRISELAYGTDKARSLFKDMMIKAADELDFDAGDDPLMIEAIPINSECIVLTVTKVEDPEELDTRFARFAPDLIDDKYDDDEAETDADMLWGKNIDPDILPTLDEIKDITRVYSFSSMGDLISLSGIIASEFTGNSSIYKSEKSGRYYLLLEQADMDPISFGRILNIASEYGICEKNMPSAHAYLKEHCELILGSDGIKQLAGI